MELPQSRRKNVERLRQDVVVSRGVRRVQVSERVLLATTWLYGDVA